MDYHGDYAVAFEALCPSVHKKLLSGTCPWCGCPIIKGQAVGLYAAMASCHDMKAVGRRIAEAISRYFSDSSAPSVQPELGDPKATDDLAAIIDQIGRCGKKALPLLCAALKDAEWSIRLAAVNALGRIGPGAKKALSALWPLLQDENQIVRDAAHEAIKRIDLKQ